MEENTSEYENLLDWTESKPRLLMKTIKPCHNTERGSTLNIDSGSDILTLA